MPEIAISDFAKVYKTNEVSELLKADLLLVAGGESRGEPVRIHNVDNKEAAIKEAVETYGRTGYRVRDQEGNEQRPYNLVAIRFTNRNVLDPGYAFYLFQHMNQNLHFWERLYQSKVGKGSLLMRQNCAITIKDVERLTFPIK